VICLNLGTSESVVGWSKRTALFTFSFCFPLLHFCKKADGTTSEAVEKPRKEKQLLHMLTGMVSFTLKGRLVLIKTID
jgi:hypothetical protein